MSFKRGCQRIKFYWDKFWFLVWKDDSFKGWVISLIFIFITIKFIFLPGLSLITGTSLPLAIVESCSMYHDGNLFSSFNSWWKNHESKYEEQGVEKEKVADFTMRRGFNKGDILFVIGANPDKLKIGDIIIFDAGQNYPIIHRIIKVKTDPKTNEKTFSTMGDNNNGQLSVETNIKESQLMGKAVFKLAPYAGWLKLVFFDLGKPEPERGFCDEN